MLIIDMPIPVKEWNCLDCKALCVDMFRHYCGITKKTIDTLKNMRARPDWCPIKGVLPDEHGDLIDRDELLKECYPDDEFDAHVIYADDIQNAKAVVAAEGAGGGGDEIARF